MLRVFCCCFLFVWMLADVSIVHAGVVDIEGTVKSVDASKRTITIESDGKPQTLDFSSKVKITNEGKDASLDSLKPGQSVKLAYHDDLDVVIKVEITKNVATHGDDSARWQFWDTLRNDLRFDKVLSVSHDGILLSAGSDKVWHLASVNEYSECELVLEFYFPKGEVRGNPYVAVSSTLPNPEGSDRGKQIPFGIEVQLTPEHAGQISLPSKFVDVPLSQGPTRDPKDRRKINPIRKASVVFGEWNKLEMKCDKERKVVVRINEIVANELSAAVNVSGYIVIQPAATEMRIRNAKVVSHGVEIPLTFDNVE